MLALQLTPMTINKPTSKHEAKKKKKKNCFTPKVLPNIKIDEIFILKKIP
jgi:hypothetical protein